MMNVQEPSSTNSNYDDAKTQVKHYLNNVMSVSPNTDPLQWWRENGSMYPQLAHLARKWLSTVATSTPSERVFSDCGNTLTDKRNRLGDEGVQDQVMIKRNLAEMNLMPSDLAEMMIRKK